MQSRHHPAVQRMRELVAGGTVGQILSASLTSSLASPETWSRRYAALFDHTQGVNHLAVVGGHSLDMFGFIVGNLTELSATLTTRITRITMAENGEEIDVTSPDQIVAAGLLESGAATSVHIMTGGPRGEGFRTQVHGRHGRLELLAADDSLVGPTFTLRLSTSTQSTVLPIPEPLQPPAVHNVQQVYADLADAIRTGNQFEPDFATAAHTHHVLDAIKHAAETGQRQHLT